jgi:MerR family transcriptional regulator, aldehyde-responsive regulator
MNIAQVAKQLNLTPSTFRYYEQVGLIPPVNRRESGIRNYDEDDIKWIEFIRCMRDAGLPIEQLMEYTALFMEGDSTIEVRRNILVDERTRLIEKRTEIDNTIKRLDIKIDDYDEKLLKKEADLKRRTTTKRMYKHGVNT